MSTPSTSSTPDAPAAAPAAAVTHAPPSPPEEGAHIVAALLKEHKLIMPHDVLFKAHYWQPAEVEALCRDIYPAAIVNLVDWPALRRISSEVFDSLFVEHRADMAFEAFTALGGCLPFIFHLEEEAEPDTFFAVRLLAYGSGFYSRFLKEHPGAPLPRLLIIVVHNGKTPWRGATNFQHLLAPAPTPAAEAALAPFAFKFDFRLIDLASLSPDEMVGSRRGRLILEAMLSGRREDLTGFFTRRCSELDDLSVTDEVFYTLLIRYLISVSGKLSCEEVEELVKILPERTGTYTMTIIESLIKEREGKSLEKGIVIGEERGEVRGEERGIVIGEERGKERGIVIGEERGILIGRICDRYKFWATPLTDSQEAHLRKMSLTYLQDLFAQVDKGVFPKI
ncbi:MAG: Rpn family recombination-promoting nuclease/putative transposase [Puniceicoccales bacterium]|jgi:hypothetical protein|nr:Rpn family recombination-promoting nuclease/putative transposase [Puniceicoccales bacterium]